MLSLELIVRSAAAALTSNRRTALVIHGLLGSGKNMIPFGKDLLQSHCFDQVILASLRGHGDSFRRPGTITTTVIDDFSKTVNSSSELLPMHNNHMLPPNTLQACAEDIVQTLSHSGIAGDITSIVGHSLGGKVTLELLRLFPCVFPLRNVWVLDSQLSSGKPVGDRSSDISSLLSLLCQNTGPFASRRVVSDMIVQNGFSSMVGAWVTSNLVVDSDKKLRYGFDLRIAKDLLKSYEETNAWNFLNDSKTILSTLSTKIDEEDNYARIHIVWGSLSSRWTPSELQTLDFMSQTSGGRIVSHCLIDAGHWIHVDQPKALVDLIKLYHK